MASIEPILIIGAGISGLSLAQACRKEGIPFRIFERDESPTSRSAGWGLTLNWSLPTFRSLLSEDILSRLPETYVNKAAVDAGEKGNFTFFDLSTGEAKWNVPAAERIRVSRQRLRNLMLTGLDVEWNKTLKTISTEASRVTASFSDESIATGSFLVACDGAHSSVRQMNHPHNHENYQLPVRFIGAGVNYPESQIKAIRELDPYFLQGSDPRTDAYLWFSFLDAPGDPGAPEPDVNGEKMYRCQVMTSWPFREGFFGRAGPSDVPNTDFGQRSWMMALSAEWVEPFRSIIQNLPGLEDDGKLEIKPVELSDWVPRKNETLVFDGRVALLGDAAHAMVMFRGEGAQQSIEDVRVLLQQIRPLYSGTGEVGNDLFKAAVQKYEEEMVERTEIAVLASRQACVDAHDFKRLNDQSPLVRERLTRADLEDMQQ